MTRALPVAVIVGVLSTGLSAQVATPYPVTAYLDAPAKGASVTPAVIFGGWAMNWWTCRHVASVMLWRINTATKQIEHVPATVYWGPRPDVQGYAVWSGCYGAEEALGFAVIPKESQPYGPWRYALLFTDLTAGQPGSINWTATTYRDVIVQ